MAIELLSLGGIGVLLLLTVAKGIGYILVIFAALTIFSVLLARRRGLRG